jgi:hypothetical protein
LIDTNTFWIDPRCRNAIVLLQDHAQHIGEAVDGCRKSLTTMYSVVFPHNPLPENFWVTAQCFEIKPTRSSFDRTKLGGWC